LLVGPMDLLMSTPPGAKARTKLLLRSKLPTNSYRNLALRHDGDIQLVIS
jgi:hypothetical protein